MRLDELQAAFLNVKLKKLNDWTAKRQQIASWNNETLRDVENITLPKVADGATHVNHLYLIRIKKRNELQKHLNDQGVGSLIHYPIPPHLQEAYRYLGFKYGDFPIAKEIAETALSLPLWPGMTNKEVVRVSNCISDFINERR
jgi:dTDP-4-amino-4,6-dideoxygalactose transaminase